MSGDINQRKNGEDDTVGGACYRKPIEARNYGQTYLKIA